MDSDELKSKFDHIADFFIPYRKQKLSSTTSPVSVESSERYRISVNCNTLQADSTVADYFNLNLHVH